MSTSAYALKGQLRMFWMVLQNDLFNNRSNEIVETQLPINPLWSELQSMKSLHKMGFLFE